MPEVDIDNRFINRQVAAAINGNLERKWRRYALKNIKDRENLSRVIAALSDDDPIGKRARRKIAKLIATPTTES